MQAPPLSSEKAKVAIPLEQGLFFNDGIGEPLCDTAVAIPLEQGLFFNLIEGWKRAAAYWSQSLWSRDYFLMRKAINNVQDCLSQSLWSRDYFLIVLTS